MQTQGSLLAHNAILNLAGNGVRAIVALAAIPFIIQGLGTERYGVFSLALIVLGYFSLFDLGLGRATTKFVAEYLGREDTNQLPGLIWTSLGLQLLQGTLGGLVLAASTPFLVGKVFNITPALAGEAEMTFLLLAASLPIVLGTATLRGTLAAAQRFDFVNAVNIPAGLVTFLIPAVGASLGLRLPEIVLFLVLSRVGAALAYLALCFRVFPILSKTFSFELKLLRPLLVYGSWVTVTNVVGPVLVYLDRVLIGSLLSMAAVAYYIAPYQFATALWILPGSLIATVFPAFSSVGAADARQTLESLYAHTLKALLLTVGPLVLLVVFYARDILRWWLGVDFANQSALVLQILCIGVLINSLAWVPSSLLQGLGRPDLTGKFHLLELPLYVGGLWILVEEMGIVGAALAWVLRVTLDASLVFGACHVLKLVHIRGLAQNGLWRSVAVFVALAAMLSFVSLAGGGELTQTLLVVLLVALFAVATWDYAFDDTDRSFLMSTFTRLAVANRGYR